ncbi:MAG: aminotransferase class V-fold PLP-dependent enzyme, partial [Gammaproteobacteria bacterium]|nr:aminotransferase class V-fold PLP-dependent enzyme [Gammaproteobacteria bacterium]
MAPLFVPGPVDVDPEVLNAQTKAVLPHRSKEYEKIFHRAEGKMRPLFGTKYRVFITASSGSGLQEAAVRNLANQRVLACVNGAFSQRWFNVALSNGKNVDRVDAEWGQPITVEMVAEQLKKEDYEILTIVHNETSVGLENPVK